LAIAYESCKRFAQNLEGWILLQGSFGCGKTHLAAAIANFAVSMGAPTLFLTVPDLLDTLRFAFSSNEISFEERFEQIRSSALLILDDFGTQNATEWAQEKIFQIINFRYINHLPMVITTNLPQDDIDGRIRSRLDDPDLVQKIKIDAPDYRNPTGDMGQSHLSSLHIHNTKTFEMFSLRQDEGLVEGEAKQLQLAFRAAQEFAKKPKGWLVFIGSFGSGKTHLAAAIAQYLEETGPEPLFISIPDFLDHLRSTFSPSSTVSFDREFDRALYAPVLIMDDLTTQAMTPWVKTKLHQLILTRFDHELPTVITTSDSLEQMDPRIFSRLRNSTLCTIYAITVPPYSGKANKSPVRKSTLTTKR
jgi:DNA replication protein DnaC